MAKILQGIRPEIPVHPPVPEYLSGLWAVVQRCWAEDPFERPALFEIRYQLSVAAEMWPTDLALSGTIDGFISVPQNVLLSEDSSDAGGYQLYSPRHVDLCSRSARERQRRVRAGNEPIFDCAA